MPELIATTDLEEPIFTAYREHYNRLAADGLEASFQWEDRHQIETERLRGALGDVSGLEVCDVGVGKGLPLEPLKQGGARSITGVDIASPYMRRLAGDPGLRLLIANAERLPFREEFDLIVSTDVLEHVLNPGDFLVSVQHALRPSGRFVVRVPYRDDLVAYATQTCYPYPFVHLRSFDRRGLRDLLRQAGLAVRDVQYSSFYAMKLRWALGRQPRIERRVRDALENHFGGTGKVTKIDPRLGRLLMRPNTIYGDHGEAAAPMAETKVTGRVLGRRGRRDPRGPCREFADWRLEEAHRSILRSLTHVRNSHGHNTGIGGTYWLQKP